MAIAVVGVLSGRYDEAEEVHGMISGKLNGERNEVLRVRKKKKSIRKKIQKGICIGSGA